MNSRNVTHIKSLGDYRKLTIVCFSAVNWNFLFQRVHHIATGFAERGHSVIFFNPPNNLPRDRSFQKPPLQYITDFVHYMVHGIIRKKAIVNRRLLLYDPDNYFGPREVLEHMLTAFNLLMLRVLSFLNFQSAKVDVWVFFEPYYSWFVLPFIGKGRIVYDCADESSAFSNVPSNIAETEENLIKRSSVIFASSRRLAERIAKTNVNCFYLPNAVDFQHFFSARRIRHRPRDIESLANPIIGFIGAICDWIDIDLICELAEAHPNYSILLVGPVTFGQTELDRHANIVMVGTKNYETLPQYLSFMTVCLIPFKINKLTLASNPIKLYEYLAAGKPVVSTDLPEIESNASDIVLIGKDHKDFIQKVEAAVEATARDEESAIARRTEFARANSWGERVQSMERLFKKLAHNNTINREKK